MRGVNHSRDPRICCYAGFCCYLNTSSRFGGDGPNASLSANLEFVVALELLWRSFDALPFRAWGSPLANSTPSAIVIGCIPIWMVCILIPKTFCASDVSLRLFLWLLLVPHVIVKKCNRHTESYDNGRRKTTLHHNTREWYEAKESKKKCLNVAL